MPTYLAEFEIGQLVVLYIEGQEYRSTITRAYWDAGAEDWFYQVAGLAGCEIPAYEVHPA
jgi:hypothetical protein